MNKKYITSVFAIMVALPLFVSAEATSTATTTPIVATSTKITFVECQKTCTAKRETALTAARATYNASSTENMETRKGAYEKALALATSSDRVAAKKLALENYKKSQRLAQTTYSATRKAIWNTFEEEMKRCRDARKLEENKTKSDRKEEIEKKKEEIKENREAKNEEIKTLREQVKEKVDAIRNR